jgi:hypothetical protein
MGVLGRRKRAARSASFIRISCAPSPRQVRAPRSAQRIQMDCGLRASCASSFARSVGSRSRGRFRPQASRWRCTGEWGRVRPDSYMFPPMFWPLIGGFIAFVLIAVILGWIMDTSRHRDADRH